VSFSSSISSMISFRFMITPFSASPEELNGPIS
jgi:hypothetical protein